MQTMRPEAQCACLVHLFEQLIDGTACRWDNDAAPTRLNCIINSLSRLLFGPEVQVGIFIYAVQRWRRLAGYIFMPYHVGVDHHVRIQQMLHDPSRLSYPSTTNHDDKLELWHLRRGP